MLTKEEHDYILSISHTTILTFSEAKWLFNEFNGNKDFIQKGIQLCNSGINPGPLIKLYRQKIN